MVDDDYAELDSLKRSLKSKGETDKKKVIAQVEQDSSKEELLDSIKELNTQIKELLEIFRLAAQQMKAEDTAYEKLSEQFETLIKNDQDIARGVLMLINMVKEQKPIVAQRPPSILPIEETKTTAPSIVAAQMQQQENVPQMSYPQPSSPRLTLIDPNQDAPQEMDFDFQSRPLLDLGEEPSHDEDLPKPRNRPELQPF